ncbi:glycosyltransferase family 4 protein [Ornithinimicrobium cerasi]|nr:glycosyltransferase family 4 protein [Ornithinimicrobium cerasi]
MLSDSFAGVERHVAVLANEQARRGHSVEVWGGDPQRMRTHLHGAVRQIETAGVAVTAARSLAASSSDLVHAHMTAAEAVALTARLGRGVPLVSTRHFAARRGSGHKGRLIRAVLDPQVDAQIAISRYVAGAIGGPSTVIYPGVEAVDTRDVARRPVVLVVQRLQPAKRTAVALRAFAVGAPRGWSLEVVGRGPELADLQRLAVDLKIAERTSFLGFRNDVAQIMRSSAVLIAPCEIEGLGLSVLEAMSQGLPVLASRAGAHPETVGRAVDGQLFPPGESAAAGMMLASLCEDREWRSQYGEELRTVQRSIFTPAAQAEGTQSVYQEVLR